MGTAGNRTGYKMYNFNTTVRMPDKNIEILEIFDKYAGQLFNIELKTMIYLDIIKNRVLTPIKMNPSIREKIREGLELNAEEEKDILINSTPKNGVGGRIGDYYSAMRNQGFIQKQDNRYRITNIGKDLMKLSPKYKSTDEYISESDIYTKAMLKLEYGSIDRETALNKANPFLNTLFVINGINKYCKDNKLPENGITDFEFGVFVLTMVNCNYEKVIKEILKYRENNGSNNNFEYANNYLNSIGLLDIEPDTLYGSASYTDEVLRKFKKTALFSIVDKFSHKRINFSSVEIEKTNLLLKEYSDYKWINYRTTDDYYEAIESTILPWEKDDSNFVKAIKHKAEIIGFNSDISKINREIGEKIEKEYNNYVFQNDKSKLSNDLIKNELRIIDGSIKAKSIFPDIENYVKLEYFISILLSNKYDKKYVKSNLTFYDDGTPKSTAPGGEADIEFFKDNINYNFEVTTIANADQQYNKETTTVFRHLNDKYKENQSDKIRAVLIAPYIHYDTIYMYQFESNKPNNNVVAVPMTIESFIQMVDETETFEEFDLKITMLSELLKSKEIEEYQNMINGYKFEPDD